MQRTYSSTAYRYPNEHLILGMTVILVLLVIAITAAATVCLSVVFVILALLYSYSFTRQHHQALMANAVPVNPSTSPQLTQIFIETGRLLQTESIQAYVVPARAMNAYTFGLTSPKVIVLYAPMLEAMSPAELQFIIGHEMGHIRLGHTALNSLVGGLAGIPSSLGAAALLQLALRSWNRACEISADRAGLLACGSLPDAIRALVKLEAGEEGHTPGGMQRALERIEAEDDLLTNNLSELLNTHPMIVRRIEQLKRYAASAEYLRLQALFNQNINRQTI